MDAVFDEFVRARSGRLMRLAVLLVQDHALAEDLLQTALARSWSAWRRIEGDPEPYVRRVMVNTYNSWWRRRWTGERPVPAVPDRQIGAPQSQVDARDEVWRALARLPRQQRAVLVLRYFEDMSEADIASVLSISPGAVKNYASKALAKLRVDPSLMMRGGPEPVAADHVGAVRAKVRRRGRTRVVAVAGVLAVLLALAALMLVDKPPMPTVDPVLPTSSLGDKRVVAVLPWQDLSRGPATVVWTPQYLRPTLVYVDCRMPGVDDAWRYLIRVSVNGKAIRGSACEPPARDTEPVRFDGAIDLLPSLMLRALGVSAEAPTQITVTVEPPPGRRAAGRVALVLAQHTGPHMVEAFQEVRGGGHADSLTRPEITVPWQGDLYTHLMGKDPGRYWLTVNGVRLASPWGTRSFEGQLAAHGRQLRIYRWPEGVDEPAMGTPVRVSVETDRPGARWDLFVEDMTWHLDPVP